MSKTLAITPSEVYRSSSDNNDWAAEDFRTGYNGGDQWRSKLVLPIGNTAIGKSTRLTVKLTVGDWACYPGTMTAVLSADGTLTPAQVLSANTVGVYRNGPHDDLVKGSGFIAQCHPFEDEAGTTVLSYGEQLQARTGIFYLIFDTDQLKANTTYYIYAMRDCPSSKMGGFTVCRFSGISATLTYEDAYTVSFDTGGVGTAPEAVAAGSGETITLPTMVAEGYSFRGWAESEGATSGMTGSYTVTKTVTLYAVWVKICTISYHANGVGTAPAEVSVEQGTSITLPTMSAVGYRFLGWAENAGASSGMTGSYTVDSSVTLYAIWVAVYTVYFDGNGMADAPDPVTVTAGQSIQLPYLEADGYAFLGWAETSGADDGMVGYYTPKYTVTLYAVWLEQYTITFDAKGVTEDPDAYTINAGDTIQLPEPEAEGYRFAGWSEDPDAGSGMTGVYEPESSVTLYAIWITLHTVNFDAQGVAEDPDPVTVEEGKTVQLPSLAANGWRFQGWSEDPYSTVGMTGSIVPYYSMTLYAIWAKAGSYFRYVYDGSLVKCPVRYVYNGRLIRCKAYMVKAGKLVKL